MSTRVVARLTDADQELLQSLASDASAQVCAMTACEEWFAYHRGAAELEDRSKETILFGNDGFDEDDRSKLEVALLVRLLRHNGIRIRGFATYGGCTWAMRVASPDRTALNQAVWYCWFRACGKHHRFAVSIVGRLALKAPRICCK